MKIRFLAVILLALLAIACKQDPIFSIIATETKPTKPRIEGAPTNIVVFNWEETPIMFVASGRLHWYAKTEVEVDVPAENPDDPPTKKTEITSRWDSNEYNIPQPGGKIISLAVTPTRLYALCFDDHNANATLRYIESGENWKNIPPIDRYPIQSIYADPENEQLFVGARVYNGSSFAIFYLDNNDTLQELRKDTSLLSGAIFRDGFFYLSTRGEIFQVKDDFTETKPLREKIVIMGMIKLKNEDAENGPTIIAVAREGGSLYEVNADSIEMMTYTGDNNSGKTIVTGNYATGALALWEGPADSHPEPTLKKLIAGVQGRLSTVSSSSSYTHGYVEFDLKYNDGSFDTSSLRHDTNRLESVDDRDRYTASLGKHPINHLFQAPPEIDPNRTFFASTQTTGLWSYRYRDNEGWKGFQWNAEE
jgi:hypothetical protein